MDMKGKVVLVTGASSGIGRATAEYFAGQGAQVALAARSADVLSEMEGQLPGSFAVPTDMLDDAAVANMVQATYERYHRIDVLVNNAGRGMHLDVMDAGLDDYRELFNLNVVSVLNAMQQAVPIMQEQAGGGHIVNISSGTTKRLMPGLAPYSSTKHALNNLTLIAREELAPLGITVSLVHPSMTDTEFGRNSVGTTEQRGAVYAGSDTPESVALLIQEALDTGDAEVLAHSLRRLAAPK